MTATSLIVVNWNGAGFLDDCLAALLIQTTSDDEIIVVDNDSFDSSVDIVRSRFSDVKLVCNERNLGYAGGSNVGLQAAQGEHLILLNPDVRVRAGWLAALKHELKDEQVGVVGCKLLYPDGVRIQHAGGAIRLPLALADHHGYRQLDNGQWDQAREVDYVTGAAFALRRDVLDKVGPFDEGFYPAYYEEVDYCYRVRDFRYQVRYVPQAVATHFEHTAVGEGSYHYVRFFHRNRLRFVLKHFGYRFFLEDFLPAEQEWLTHHASSSWRRAYSTVVLDVMMNVPNLHTGGAWASESADNDAFDAVLTALTSLRDPV